MGISRRSLLLQTAGAVLLSSRAAHAQAVGVQLFEHVAGAPSFVVAYGEGGTVELERSGSTWGKNGIEVRTSESAGGQSFAVQSPKEALLRIHVRWAFQVPEEFRYLGDQWERSYGDLAWRSMEPERPLPWYFLATSGTGTAACGVQTGAGAFAYWQVDLQGVSLWLDVRNGGRGVQLGSRELPLAKVIAKTFPQQDPFTAAKLFCRSLCESPRLPKQAIYGGNNWYYAYGKSSASDILADSERMAVCAGDAPNRPWMVIDDGWQPNPTAGPWNTGNTKFPDMPKLAADMRAKGVQPGIWMRPLFTRENVPPAWCLQSPGAGRQKSQASAWTLDPTVPEVQAKVEADIRLIAKWKYGLIKHDFSTFDLLGQWGFTMGANVTDGDWSFSNRTATNAEVIRRFYTLIRKAAGDDVLVLGCNTVGHLSAGLFELQRTGDDTSGRDWARTRKMGVNTLAFRMPQHNAFFAIDADCVGLTKSIPWHLNEQWLDLLARSGTPLFVSLAPDAFGQAQKEALKKAFAFAAVQQPQGEPLDWLHNNEPGNWRLRGKQERFDWFGAEGTPPSFGG